MSEPAIDRNQIGRYRIQSRIGFGSQGLVYEALDPELERSVAIKVLDPDPQITADVMEAAYSEARAAASLDHPSIASIYDFGVEADRPYLVFQYVPGIALNAFLEGRDAIGEADVWSIMEPVLKAIEHAHAVGVAHLDLKPHNIMVTPDGEPKVLDFGLARFFTRSNTETRSQIGTLRYMSPEHFAGRPLGPYTDVFALCLMLYEMLSGRPVIDAENTTDLDESPFLKAVDTEPLSAKNVSKDAIQVLSEGLAIDPKRRIANAGALLERLRAVWAPSKPTSPVDDRAVQFVMRRLKTRGDLPAFPKVVLDVNRMTGERSVATISQIANVVLRDNALSTRLLRLANSAYHTTLVKATSISNAISRLGLEQVRVAANGMGYFGAMTGKKCPTRLREMVLISFASGLVARHFASSRGLQKVEEAMLCGMLFNTGEHLVIHCLPEEYEDICAIVEGPSDQARLVASREVLGVDYARLGSAVAATWHLPDEIVIAIGLRSLDAPEPVDDDDLMLPRLAAAANELCERAAACEPDEACATLNEIAARHSATVDLDVPELMAVVQSMAQKMHSFAPVLGINVDTSSYLQALARWLPEAQEKEPQEAPAPRRAWLK